MISSAAATKIDKFLRHSRSSLVLKEFAVIPCTSIVGFDLPLGIHVLW